MRSILKEKLSKKEWWSIMRSYGIYLFHRKDFAGLSLA